MMLVRRPLFIKQEYGKNGKKPLSDRNRDARPIVMMSDAVGTGIFIPRPTKKSVTKKSRMMSVLAITFPFYGNVERLTPATRATISRDRPNTPGDGCDEDKLWDLGNEREDAKQ